MDMSNLLKVDFYHALLVTYGVKILGAVAIFYIGKFIVNFVISIARKSFSRTPMDHTLSAFIISILRVVLLGLVIITAFSQVGIDTSSFAAMIAAAGLAIGLAFQGSLSNFSSGIMLIIFRPFKIGDAVTIAGISGSVRQIDIFTTTLHGADGVEILIPNNKIISDSITNFSSQPIRRVDMMVRLQYDADLDKARTIIKNILESDTRILKEPAPTIAVTSLSEFGVDLVVRPHVKTPDHFSVMLDTQEKIQKEFRLAGDLPLIGKK